MHDVTWVAKNQTIPWERCITKQEQYTRLIQRPWEFLVDDDSWGRQLYRESKKSESIENWPVHHSDGTFNLAWDKSQSTRQLYWRMDRQVLIRYK